MKTFINFKNCLYFILKSPGKSFFSVYKDHEWNEKNPVANKRPHSVGQIKQNFFKANAFSSVY